MGNTSLVGVANKNISSNTSKKTEKTIDDFLLSPSTAGVVGATDKVISTASKNYLLGKRTYQVVRNMNRFNRRAQKLSRTYPKTKSLVSLREGFGVVGVALAATIAVEDVKNNDTVATRAGAIAIDGIAIAGSYASADVAAGVGTSIAVGAVEGIAGLIGVAALPEIAVGAIAVTGAVVGVYAAGWLISSAGGGVKKLFDLK